MMKGKNHPKQLQNHNMPTYDVENTNGTNKGRYFSLTSRGLFPEEQKVCYKSPEEQEKYVSFINTSSTRARLDGKT